MAVESGAAASAGIKVAKEVAPAMDGAKLGSTVQGLESVKPTGIAAEGLKVEPKAANLDKAEAKIPDNLQMAEKAEKGLETPHKTLTDIVSDNGKTEATPDIGYPAPDEKPTDTPEVDESKRVYENAYDDPAIQQLEADIVQATHLNPDIVKANSEGKLQAHQWSEVNIQEGAKAYDAFVEKYPEKAQAYAENNSNVRIALERKQEREEKAAAEAGLDPVQREINQVINRAKQEKRPLTKEDFTQMEEIRGRVNVQSTEKAIQDQITKYETDMANGKKLTPEEQKQYLELTGQGEKPKEPEDPIEAKRQQLVDHIAEKGFNQEAIDQLRDLQNARAERVADQFGLGKEERQAFIELVNSKELSRKLVNENPAIKEVKAMIKEKAALELQFRRIPNLMKELKERQKKIEGRLDKLKEAPGLKDKTLMTTEAIKEREEFNAIEYERADIKGHRLQSFYMGKAIAVQCDRLQNKIDYKLGDQRKITTVLKSIGISFRSMTVQLEAMNPMYDIGSVKYDSVRG